MSEPLQQQRTVVNPKAKHKQEVTWPYTNIPLPQPLGGWVGAVQWRWDQFGNYLKQTLPSPIINNSSNVVGSMQLVAEAMQFKSSNNNLVRKQFHNQPWMWLIEVVRNIYTASFQKAQVRLHPSDLLRPSFYSEAARNLVDLERASLIDSKHNTVELRNHWSARSGLTGISSMTLATLLPDRKETDQEIEGNATLARTNPLGYVGRRVYQAVNPLEWWGNKRQISGLGMTVTGLLSFVSGWRQIAGDFIAHPVTGINMAEKTQVYSRNYGQMAGGVITTLAGIQLWMGLTNQQGWTNFGSTQLLRIFTLPPSIAKRFKPDENGRRDPNANWYLGAQMVMVGKNSTASLIGGAERHGGEVIERRPTDPGAAVRKKLSTPNYDKADGDEATPATTLTQIAGRDAAMPERLAEFQKQSQQTAPATA